MYKEYATERLILKTLSIVDAKITVDYYNKNEKFLEKWDPAHEELFFSQNYQENMLARHQIEMINGKSLKLWIFKKENPYTTIGNVHFNNIIRGSFLSCYIHFQLDERELGYGYAREAVDRAIKVIFDEYKLHRIEANVLPNNTAALSLLSSIGFHKEGLSLKRMYMKGKWEDHIRMVILNRALE